MTTLSMITSRAPSRVSFRAFLALLILLAALIGGCEDANKPEPTSASVATQGQLLSDVAVRRDQLASKLVGLLQLSDSLEAAGRTLNSGAPNTTDYKDLRVKVEALAAPPGAPMDPKAPAPPPRDDRALDDVAAIFDAQYDTLYTVVERFAPSYGNQQKALPSTDDGGGTAEIYYQLNSRLGRAVPRSLAQCRGFGSDPAGPPSYRTSATRAGACLQLVTELEKDWLHRAAVDLGDELQVRKKRVDRDVVAVQDEIKAKDAALLTLRDNLRSATSLDTLVKWGFPAMAGVVAMLFLIVRAFKEPIQRSIIETRLLVDVVIALVLVTTILILGLAKSLTSEVLGTLMSGIIGYTLGRAALGSQSREAVASAGAALPVPATPQTVGGPSSGIAGTPLVTVGAVASSSGDPGKATSQSAGRPTPALDPAEPAPTQAGSPPLQEASPPTVTKSTAPLGTPSVGDAAEASLPPKPKGKAP
jgi:hypothetical protein